MYRFRYPWRGIPVSLAGHSHYFAPGRNASTTSLAQVGDPEVQVVVDVQLARFERRY